MPVRWLWLCILLTGAAACITPFDPNLVGGDKYLTFEGVLTDAPGPYRFALTLSAGYNSTESVYDQRVTGGKLWVTDDAGLRVDFADDGKGNFTSPVPFRGQTGRAYTLHVLYQNQTYQSQPERITSVPPIDTVYSAYQSGTLPGLTTNGFFDVFVDVTDPADAENQYQWDWIHYEQPNFCVLYSVQAATFAKPCCSDCWNISRSAGQLILASDQLINGKRLTGQRIMQVPFDDTAPYYLKIGQYSLSRGAYQYWKSIQTLTGNVGGVFDTTPATLTGNLRNLDPAGRSMLGYFQVSAYRQRIVYIRRLGVLAQPFAKTTYPVYPTCEPCTESLYRTARKPEGWQ